MPNPPRANVAIITRTRERPLLLQRACQSVLNQSYQDWIHIIVNDGGDPLPVDAVLQSFLPAYQNRLLVIHNPQNIGMEAASNRGIRASRSQWITIHDDDDSWHPDFLTQTTTRLESAPPSRNIRGVVTQTTRIVEEITENTITQIQAHSFNPDLTHISLFRIAEENTFPPISFIFDRATANHIGLFNESLPVLGDWDFNLRFLLHANIDLIPQELAFYHHRTPSKSSSNYGNTVTDQDHLHRTTEQQLIHQWSRAQSPIHAGLHALTSHARESLLLRRENNLSDSKNMTLRPESSLYQINAL